MTDFTNFPFDQIHRFAKNIKNVNDGHLAQIIQLKYAHTWYIPIDLHSYNGISIGARAHKYTPNNEISVLGNRKTTNVVMEMDMAHAYSAYLMHDRM
jgi:hypothetical protein